MRTVGDRPRADLSGASPDLGQDLRFTEHWAISSKDEAVGVRNYLIEGGSGTGKTTVANELQRRGFHVIHGDRELAYPGDPETGEPADLGPLKPRIWNVDRVKVIVSNQDEAVTFFCGGSGNVAKYVDLFDRVFILEVADLAEVMRRIDERVAVDPDDWGGRPEEREIIARLHRTKEEIPQAGTVIDATAPIERVVDEILRLANMP
jgi:hypothetical protein